MTLTLKPTVPTGHKKSGFRNGIITETQKRLYAEIKLGLPRTAKIDSIIYDRVRERDAFLTEKHNAYQILRSSYRRLNFQQFLNRLYHWQMHGATRQLQSASARLLRTLVKSGITDSYTVNINVLSKTRKRN